MPVRLITSPGQRNDIAFAHDLIDGIEAVAAIAEKGYDADHLANRITEAVISPKRNRKVQRNTTLISTRSAIVSSASSASSRSFGASQPDTTNSSPTSWVS